MPRPWIVMFLFLLIVSTSQLEWTQLLGNEIEAKSEETVREDWKSKAREAVKEKQIILSQEKNIQALNELVQNLREQLSRCKSVNFAAKDTSIDLAEQLNQREQESISVE
ncbi:hypothetical protein LINGRAHAP2_LOCUS4907 [Linum grandiflorum]